jgi:hypothetical protein
VVLGHQVAHHQMAVKVAVCIGTLASAFCTLHAINMAINIDSINKK